jgi:hypothetical protein
VVRAGRVSLSTLIAAVFGVAALLVASAATAAIKGTYTGKTSGNNTVTVNVSDQKLQSVSSIVVTRVECELFTSSGGTVNDGSEVVAIPVNTSPLPGSIDTVDGQTVGGFFPFGDPGGDELAQGEQQTGGFVDIDQSGAELNYFATVVTERVPASPASGPATRRRTCQGGETIPIELGKPDSAAKVARLKAPRGIKRAEVKLPPLADLGDDGLVISAEPKRKGGKLTVDVRLAEGSDDPFDIGNRSLGDGSRSLKAKRTGTVRVAIKRPIKTPGAGDDVRLEIELGFKPDGGKPGSARSSVALPK